MSKKRSSSCEFLAQHHCRMAEVYAVHRMPRSSSARKKSVQWCTDLEQVRYYRPHRSKSEVIKRKIKKAFKKERFNDMVFIKDIRPKVGLNCMAGKSWDSEWNFDDYNAQWDVLFDLYANK